MKWIPVYVGVLAAALMLSAATPAHADREDEAQQVFQSATALFQRGEYEDAARRFMQAFKIVPHADTAFNAALSWDAAGDAPQAAEAFKLAVDRGLERQARERAQHRLHDLDDKLGRVRVQAPAGAKVLVGDEERDAPAELYVQPGVHDVVVKLPDGTRRVRRIHAEAGEISHVDIDQGKDKNDSAPNLQRSIGWGSLAVAAVLGVVSAVQEVHAASLRSAFNISSRTDPSKRKAVLHAQTWATVGWVATGVAGVTGIALVLTSSSGTETRVSVVPGGVTLAGTF